MRSEALEIQIEEWNENTVLNLRGRFHNEQVPNIREKISDLLASENRGFILDFSEVTELDEAVPPFLLEVLNSIKGKEGELKIVCGGGAVLDALEKSRNIFDLYPDRNSIMSGGFLKRLQTRGITLSKKTGVRLSRSIAMLLFVALTGWFVSLLVILIMQYSQVSSQKKELSALRQWKSESEKQIQVLQERLKPLEDLGVAADSTK